MSNTICNAQNLKRLYHAIIIHEAKLLSGHRDAAHLPCYVSPDNQQPDKNIDFCALRRTDYGLELEELKNMAKTVGVGDECLESLIERGFLIPLRDDRGRMLYRSFHMDMLLRASDVRIQPGGGKMVLQSHFVIGEHIIDDFSQALLLSSPDGVDEEKEFYELLNRNLGDKLAKIYIEVLRDYLAKREARGLTYFQLKSLKEIIASMRSRNVYVITAPAGAGKTEIFLFSILYKLLENAKNGVRNKILIVYPRKFLEIDQSERIVALLRILNEKLKQYSFNTEFSIALRDGDTEPIEQEVEEAKREKREYVEYRGIRCGQNGTLVIRLDSVPVVACKEETNYNPYSFVKWSRKDSKEADIIVTNLHTLFFRVIARNPYDLDVKDILEVNPVDLIVLDEAHEYEPAMLGLLHCTIKVVNYVRERKNLDKLKLIISSATISNPEELARKLTDEEPLVLSYGEMIEKDERRIRELESSGRIGLTRKLIILGVLSISPAYSWETYTSQLAINFLFANKVLQSLGMDVKQAIIFLNNVKELNRVHVIIENDLQLGSPLDNAGLRGPWNEVLDPLRYRYSLRHYADLLRANQSASEEVSKIIGHVQKEGQLKEFLFPKLGKIFSGTPLDERLKIAKDIYEKNILVAIATSSLELGVDYPSVSIVANTGFTESLPSIIQRFGRAGRKLKDTLNTTLALLIVRNNPLEYVRFFESRKNKSAVLMVEGSLTPGVIEKLDPDARRDISVKVASDLDAVKKLCVLRAILTMEALTDEPDGLKPVKNEQEECDILIKLREFIVRHGNELTRVFNKADEIIKSLLEQELGFNTIEDCIEYYTIVSQRDKYLVFMNNRIEYLTEIRRILDDILRKIPIGEYAQGKTGDSMKNLTKWTEKLNTLLQEYQTLLQKITDSSLPSSKKMKNFMEGVSEKLNSLEKDSINLCREMTDKIGVRLVYELMEYNYISGEEGNRILRGIGNVCDTIKNSVIPWKG
ncbi:MAG: DEAD/DEAH box helicase [Desulfurococcales archaeon]|nr:DEAD/DEAH box helicase [Desulfurococcales archaeon]